MTINELEMKMDKYAKDIKRIKNWVNDTQEIDWYAKNCLALLSMDLNELIRTIEK